ncbi:MAG: UDP-3-O-[3-hydroxymyristoyl] N-acetylglucosamine deacetylase [Sebaldella sp.]|nr:UDP-3-O-[3-hydroxymyristoyl] N-acetylglucosamine deacetylase [Sebaldella sp.]
MKRKTIKNQISFNGIGLHKGEKIEINLKPVRDNSGITFKRIDLSGDNEILVCPENLFELERGTNIQNSSGAKVYTIEHMMSALHMLGITDLLIEIEGNELPIMDGSSIIFVDRIMEASIEELEKEVEPIIIKEPVYFSEEKDGKHIIALPYDGFKVSYTIDFNHTFLKAQYYEIELNTENYISEIARARTFCFDYEIEYMQKHNLALGGSLENAIVIKKDGVINPEGLRYETEFVRHKILDLIGDIYVLNRPIKAHLIAIKAGHFINSNLSKKLKEII